MRRLSLLVLLAVLASAASAQTAYTRYGLSDRVDEILNARAFHGALWGLYVEDLDTGRVLYERNAYAPMMPASNMKLVTTAAALDALGPGFRYQTRLYLDGPLAYGTLSGDLVVRGAGDPSFIGRARDLRGVFGAWADSLHDAGVRNVLGTIVLADDVMDNPSTRFVRTLRDELRERGITVHGDGVGAYPPGVQPEYQAMRPVASYRSPPLAAFVGRTNTESDNAYAERILRTVAAFVYPSPGPVRPGLRARAANPMLERFGVDPRSVVVADGSGLSRDNRLTAAGIVGLLRGMHRHPDAGTRDAFVRSLPLGGFTGTLGRRYGSGDARGNVRAKTGYISGVRTLSGYITNSRGHTLAFSILCNGYSTRTRTVSRAQDQIVELLADYAGM